MQHVNIEPWQVSRVAPVDDFSETVFFTGNGSLGVRGYGAWATKRTPQAHAVFRAGLFSELKPGITDMVQLPDALTLRVPQAEPQSAWEKRAAANLNALSPLPRQAFLLVSVEGFSEAEAAEILDVDEDEFSELLAEASNEISRQVATDILIIEDEPLIAMDIEEMVESLGHRVVGTARTHAEAIAMFGKTRPRMVLADIQLADGSSGIDAVNEILSSAPVPVIFITAFPERLLTGERPEPAFLVTKPFNPDMVKALISQALFFDRQAKAAA